MLSTDVDKNNKDKCYSDAGNCDCLSKTELKKKKKVGKTMENGFFQLAEVWKFGDCILIIPFRPVTR